MVTLAGKQRMRLDANLHIEVAGPTALSATLTLSRQTNSITCVDAGRHRDGKNLSIFDLALTATDGTRVGDNLARAAAARTGLLYGKKPLLHTNLTRPAAGGTGLGSG